MKKSMAWHEECVQNLQAILDKFERRIAKSNRQHIKLCNCIAFYKRQIEEAKRRGLDEFDRDRLMLKKPVDKAGKAV